MAEKKGIAGYAHKKSPSTDFVHSKLIWLGKLNNQFAQVLAPNSFPRSRYRLKQFFRFS